MQRDERNSEFYDTDRKNVQTVFIVNLSIDHHSDAFR